MRPVLLKSSLERKDLQLTVYKSVLTSSFKKVTKLTLDLLSQNFNVKLRRLRILPEVFRVLLNERSDIGLATVYRVLTQFEQAGILERSHFESGKAVYELNEGSHHDHLICTSCGKVEEFYDAEIESRQQLVAKDKGWILQDHAMSLYGLCADCVHKR